MKRTLAVLIALITVIVLVPVSTVNADVTPVYTVTAVVPDAVVPSQTFSVRYTLTNTSWESGIAGGSIAVVYDDSVFTFVSASLYSAPANWTLEDWTGSGMTGVISLNFWDETESSNALALNGAVILDITFETANDAESQYSDIEIVEEYQIAESEDYYYTEILDSATLDPVDGSFGAVSVKVEAGLILDIGSNYTIATDEYTTDVLHITNPSVNTPTMINDLTANFGNLGTVIVYDKNGNVITDTSRPIGTGCVVKTLNPDTNEVISETAIVLKGDTNGDGEYTSVDYKKLYKHVKSHSPSLTGLYFLAGRVSSNPAYNDDLTTIDYKKLKRYINGQSSI